MLLTDDFNANPTTPNYQMVLDHGYVDSYTVAKERNRESVGKEIDYLFFKAPDVEVLEHRVCGELINGEKVSDHDPVFIRFLL